MASDANPATESSIAGGGDSPRIPDFASLRRLVSLARPEAKVLVLATIALFIAAGLNLSYPLFIRLIVDGVEVPPAGCLPDDTDCVPSSYHPSCLDQPSSGLNGWTYDELGQAVRMHGDCLPDYNQVVDVLYLPEAGAGRPLPF